MELLFKYFGIIGIGMIIFNAFILKQNTKQFIKGSPELEIGYDKIFKGYIFFGSLPFVIVLIGNFSGLTSPFEYFQPKNMKPFVLFFWSTLMFIWVLGIRWIFFKKGADFLVKHPGYIRQSTFKSVDKITTKQVKIQFLVLVFASVLGLIVLWNTEIPLDFFEKF